MSDVTFSQTLFRGSLRVLDAAPEVTFSIRSGMAWNDVIAMRAEDESASPEITRQLWNQSIFSDRTLILSIGERLAQIGRRVNRSGWSFAGFLMQQHEHVEIRFDSVEVTDHRTWSMGRIVITTDSGKTGYRDVPLVGLQETELADRCGAITGKIITELSQKASRHRVDVPTNPTVVVFAPGAGGYFIHEVFGHMLEGDFVSKGLSALGKTFNLGDRIGPNCLNIVDDPADFREHVGLNRVDDEGEPITRIELVSNGILRSYLCDRAAARSIDSSLATGCARRQSYKHRPTVRMRATCVLPANSGYDLDRLIKTTERGFLAAHFMYGTANLLTGDFLLLCSDGHLIQDGRVMESGVEATVTGNVFRVFDSIDCIGDDMAVLPVQCGKAGQVIPVCVGSPAIRASGLIVRQVGNG